MSYCKLSFDFATPAKDLIPSGINLIGFPFDGTACFRKGAAGGPKAIRAASPGIESYSPYLDKDLESIQFYDLGDLPNNWEDGNQKFNELLRKANGQSRVITFGGEHSISYTPISRYLKIYDDMVLIHLDAHADFRDGYEGHYFSHASIMFRIFEQFGSNHQLIQYGIRSGTKDEFNFMKKNNTLRTSKEDFFNGIDEIDENTPIYLTLDLDFFDPSFFPGTGTPEPGGEDFHTFIKLIKALKNKCLVGADIVELAPIIDGSGNSSVFAAKVARELILCLSREDDER